MDEKKRDELWEKRFRLEDELEEVVMELNELGEKSDWKKIDELVGERIENDDGVWYGSNDSENVRLVDMEKEKLVEVVKKLRGEVDVLWDLREGNLRVGKEKVD
jgi:hypothetical protein